MKKAWIVILAVLLVFVLAACEHQGEPSSSQVPASSAAASPSQAPAQTQPAATSAGASDAPSAQIANPWTEVSGAAAVEAKTGLVMSALPEGATDAAYSVMEKEKVAQVIFTWKGDEYTFRMAPDDAVDDLSGMYVDLKAEEDMMFGDYPYEIEYNEGAEGLAEWEDKLTDVDYSVTMQTGATREKLVAVAEALIPAG